jgi:MFS family permease
MDSQEERKGKKNIALLGATSFLNDFSSEMMLPILPFFLSSLGATPLLIGLVGGIRDSLDRLLRIVFGYLSDRAGKRKPFVYLGYITSAFFKFLMALSPNAVVASSSASLERIGKGIRDAPRDAMIGQFLPNKTGTGFGLHRMLDTAGAVFGSLAALLIIAYLAWSYNTIILIAAFVALISIGPLFLVKEPPFKPYRNMKGFRYALSKLPKELLAFNIIASLFALANFSYMFFILKAYTTEGLVIPIALYVVFNIFYAAFAYPIGRHADKVGKRKIIVGGYMLFALVSLAFVHYSSLAALLVLFIFYGIANAAVKSVEPAYVTDMAPADLRATSLGTFQMMTGLAAIPSGLIAGYLWQYISPETTFMFGAVVAFAAAVLLAIKR